MKRRISRRMVFIVLGVVVMFIVVGFILFMRVAEEAFANFGLTREPHCSWGAEVEVWLDADRDGQRAADEQPMPNVTVRADDRDFNRDFNDISDTDAVTNAVGTAQLYVYPMRCTKTGFEVYVVPPPQFCVTTPERLSQSPFTFGVAACES